MKEWITLHSQFIYFYPLFVTKTSNFFLLLFFHSSPSRDFFPYFFFLANFLLFFRFEKLFRLFWIILLWAQGEIFHFLASFFICSSSQEKITREKTWKTWARRESCETTVLFRTPNRYDDVLEKRRRKFFPHTFSWIFALYTSGEQILRMYLRERQVSESESFHERELFFVAYIWRKIRRKNEKMCVMWSF